MWAINLPKTSRKKTQTQGGKRSKSIFFFLLYHNLSYRVLSGLLLSCASLRHRQCCTLMRTKHIKKSPTNKLKFPIWNGLSVSSGKQRRWQYFKFQLGHHLCLGRQSNKLFSIQWVISTVIFQLLTEWYYSTSGFFFSLFQYGTFSENIYNKVI